MALPTVRRRVLLPGDYSADSSGINAALSDGRRWLVFTTDRVELDSPIDLEPYGQGFLRLEGTASGDFGPIGSTGVRFVRNYIDEPIFKQLATTSNKTWHLYFTSVLFDGEENLATAPLCEFWNVDRCYFENSGWVGAGSEGLVLGHNGPNTALPDSGHMDTCSEAYQASTSRFVDCHFRDNANYGLQLYNAIDFTIAGGTVNNNTLFWKGPETNACDGTKKTARGVGTIMNVAFSGNYALSHSIDLDWAYLVRITGCQINEDVRLGSHTHWCWSHGNAWSGGAGVVDNGSNNLVQ